MLFDYKDQTIRAYGAIGQHEISETDFMEALDAMGGDDITIHLNSEGGDVVAGLSIYNQLQNYPGKITMQIDAIAASIASVLMTSADVVNLAPTSRIMVHRAWSIALGNASDFRNLAELLEGFDYTIAQVYAEAAGGTADQWFDIMSRETWFTAAEAVEAGLADGIVSSPAKASYDSKTPAKASVSACAGLGPAAQTRYRALRRRQELLDNGTL